MKNYAIDEKYYKKAKEIIDSLSVKEKASLCSGFGFWYTKDIGRPDVPVVMMSDGPHGLRKQKEDADHLGINESYPATCFPPACATACSFDRDLIFEEGQALGEECLGQGLSLLLGPGVNIKRSPLCGRNFEYFSEDPKLTSSLAQSFVQGVQSKNVGTSLKHYLANNQETLRMVSDSLVDQRTLREIYLAAFEDVVKNTQPWTVMCSYNKINGEFGSENKTFLTDVLRDEWGFKGFVVSDWGAVNRRVRGLEAGLDLQMPYAGDEWDESIEHAVNSRILTKETLDASATRILALVLAGADARKEDYTYDVDKHNDLARRIARESAVLLKNDNILPFDKKDDIAVIGEFAEKPRYQGAGSSHVVPHKLTTVLDEFKEKGINYSYAKGYSLKEDTLDQALIDQAVETAKNAKKVLLLVGLPDAYESEGFDREHMDLPKVHNTLIESVTAVNPNTVVVLYCGGAVLMPWLDSVKGVLLMYLTGQNNGGAIYDLVFGDHSPSGKLAETFPLALEDNPSYHNFAGEKKIVQYREAIYVGYRYYDKAEKPVAFPFGFGLSYANFKYSNLKLNKKSIKADENLSISFDIENTSDIKAKEVVQIYVKNPQGPVFRPIKELRDFVKVDLDAKEKKTVSLELDPRAFSYFNTRINDWYVESGSYEILVAASSQDIRLSQEISIENEKQVPILDLRHKAPSYYKLPADGNFPQDHFSALYGREIPQEPRLRPFTVNSTIQDIQSSKLGKIMVAIAMKQVNKQAKSMTEGEDGIGLMLDKMVYHMPLRSLSLMTAMIPHSKVEALVTMLNGEFFKGLSGLLKK
ncbi:MAG: glycoside hydrolase family 3 C-terminal domain-containing protein [Tissierellales bacterium]